MPIWKSGPRPRNLGAKRTSLLWLCWLPLDSDVDKPTSHPSSGPGDTPSSLSSFEKHTKDVLLQGQQTILNNNMTEISLTLQTSITAAEGDDSQLRSLIKTVLPCFIGALAGTDMKNNIITVQTAREKVGSFNILLQYSELTTNGK